MAMAIIISYIERIYMCINFYLRQPFTYNYIYIFYILYAIFGSGM